jgi:hypothetical protein
MTNSMRKSSNIVSLKRWQAVQEEIQAQKKRIARFTRYCYLRWGRTEEWEQDLAALTEVLVQEWAHKLVFGSPIPERIRPIAEAYRDLHPKEVQQYVNELKRMHPSPGGTAP